MGQSNQAMAIYKLRPSPTQQLLTWNKSTTTTQPGLSSQQRCIQLRARRTAEVGPLNIHTAIFHQQRKNTGGTCLGCFSSSLTTCNHFLKSLHCDSWVSLYMLNILGSITPQQFLKCRKIQGSRREDRIHSLDCACSNKVETARARPPLISLAQTLVVNEKC